MPRGAFYNSLKALVVSWLVFFTATIGQIVLPLELIKKLPFLNSVIPESIVTSQLKLLGLFFSNNATFLDRLLIAVTNATAGFLGSFREIFVIILVCNLTIFRDDKYPLVSLFLIVLRKILKVFDLDEYFMGSERPSLSLFGGEALESPLLSIGAAIVRKMLKMMDLDEYFLGQDERPSLSLFGGDHEEEMPELEYCENPSNENFAKYNDDYSDYGFDFESEFQKKTSQNSKEGSPINSPTRRGLQETPLSPMNVAEPVKEWYVFDNVFGVIPAETRDLWQREGESLRSREQSPVRKKKLIPVRYVARSEESTKSEISEGVNIVDNDHPMNVPEGLSRSVF